MTTTRKASQVSQSSRSSLNTQEQPKSISEAYLERANSNPALLTTYNTQFTFNAGHGLSWISLILCFLQVLLFPFIWTAVQENKVEMQSACGSPAFSEHQTTCMKVQWSSVGQCQSRGSEFKPRPQQKLSSFFACHCTLGAYQVAGNVVRERPTDNIFSTACEATF